MGGLRPSLVLLAAPPLAVAVAVAVNDGDGGGSKRRKLAGRKETRGENWREGK
jgi:hypothetical protein